MAGSQIPTPRPDEKVVAIIEIPAPETAVDTQEFRDFDARFTAFKTALDQLIVQHFRGALKVKAVVKKTSESSMFYRA